MIDNTITREEAQHFYDRLGVRHDLAEWYEGQAKVRALELLDLNPGQRVLNVGVGTGKEHIHIQDAISPGGRAVGLDLSPVMLELTRARTGAQICKADACALPFVASSFDRLFSSYVIDLIPLTDIPVLLADFRRVLKPGGRMALVSLTEGIDLPSRTVVALWKTAYALRPSACGGCRPLQLAALVCQAGFCQISRHVVVQMGVPSEVVVATR
jgi:demethylmenaquinone methyltransferase/2-methoxy-6-polyprenyl-1,4-benzoquinol methylase